MSMVICDLCDRIFDSDYDPDCFIERPNPKAIGGYDIEVWCYNSRQVHADELPDGHPDKPEGKELHNG